MNAAIVVGVAAIAFATALCITPYVRVFAHMVGMVDATGERRMHDQPKPRIGGLAVYLGFSFSLFAALGYLMNSGQFKSLGHIRDDFANVHDVIGLIFGGTLILMVGIWDDVMGMTPRTKIVAQAVVAAMSMSYGFIIHNINNPLHHGEQISFAWPLQIAVTLLWYLGMMNAINFIDGLDGLLSGLTVICASSLIAVDLLRGHPEIAVILAALAGGALGFLRYNWNPATIILGDSGSLFIGYVFATVSIIGGSKQAFAISLLVPLVVLALPVVDTAAAIVRRTRSGKKFYEADRGHFHHLLVLRFGLNVRQAVLLIYGMCIVLGSIAFAVARG